MDPTAAPYLHEAPTYNSLILLLPLLLSQQPDYLFLLLMELYERMQ
jgi:hypothetical protein